jgi:hypothetical protein
MAPTAPTVVTGSRLTTVGISSARRRVEMLDQIFQYDANATPTLAILSKRAPQAVSGSPKYQHLEDQPLPVKSTFNGSFNATATTINVAAGTGAYFRVGDLVLFPTAVSVASPGEVVLVTAVATDALTVTRAYTGDGVNGGTVASGENLQIISNVNAEFAGARTIKTTTEVTQTNFTQIIRTPFAVSNTLEASTLYGGNDLTYQRQKAATQHALECERAVLFGKAHEDTSTATRSTAGFLNLVTSNVVNANGTLTWPTVESLFEKVFRYGSPNKLMIVSRRIATQLDLIAEGRVVTSTGDTAYGVKIGRLQSTHGSIMTVTHDQLVDDWAGYGLVVDLENVKLRYMSGKDGNRLGMLRTNIQANDADGEEDEYLSELGLQLMLESAHGVLKGVA